MTVTDFRMKWMLRVAPVVVVLMLGWSGDWIVHEAVLLSDGTRLNVELRLGQEPTCTFGHGAGCGGRVLNYTVATMFKGFELIWESQDRCEPIVINSCNGTLFLVCVYQREENRRDFRFFAADRGVFERVSESAFPYELAVTNFGLGPKTEEDVFNWGARVDLAKVDLRDTTTGWLWQYLSLRGRRQLPNDDSAKDVFVAFQRRVFAAKRLCGDQSRGARDVPREERVTQPNRAGRRITRAGHLAEPRTCEACAGSIACRCRDL